MVLPWLYVKKKKKDKTKQTKKKVFFDFKQKMYSETLNAYFYYSSEMFKQTKK